MSLNNPYQNSSSVGSPEKSNITTSGYKHLRREQRHYIAKRRAQGVSQKQIAKELGCSPSTISREVRRLDPDSPGPVAKYDYNIAQLDYRYKRQQGGYKGKRILKNEKGELVTTTIRRAIKDKKFSPEQISNGILKNSGQIYVSKSSIYRWINNDMIYDISRQDLRRRGKKKNRSSGLTSKYQKGKSIFDRPEEINNRSTFGHFEADSILSPRTGSGRVFTMVERSSRFIFARVVEEGTADNFVKFVDSIVKKYGNIVKSITVDRGSEFANWEALESMGINIYFCNPYSPNEKGQIEHMNGEIRWFFPKNTDFSQISQKELYNNGIRVLNNMPREVLQWKTSSDVFHSELSRIAAQG